MFSFFVSLLFLYLERRSRQKGDVAACRRRQHRRRHWRRRWRRRRREQRRRRRPRRRLDLRNQRRLRGHGKVRRFSGVFVFYPRGGTERLEEGGWKRERFLSLNVDLGPPPKKINKSKFQNSDVVSWITWFCSLKGNEFFCEVRDRSICGERNSWREEEKKRSAREREKEKNPKISI